MPNMEYETTSNIGNINPSGLKKTGKKVDKKGSSKFNWKKLTIVVVLIGGTIVGIFQGIPLAKKYLVVPEVPYSITDTLAANQSATFLDEVLAYQAVPEGQPTLLESVRQLEIYLDMSVKLKDLKLNSYTDTVIAIEETDTFNKDLEEKYQEFISLRESTNKNVLSNDSLRLHTLAAELNGYKEVVDSKITTSGYGILANYGIFVAKTAVLDASGISYTNIKNLTIPYEDTSYSVRYTDPTTGKEFVIDVPSTSIIHRVINNVYRAQTKDTTDLTTDEIIEDLSGYLNDIKVAMFMRYENDGTLRTTNNYDDIREIIETSKTK